jgi:hypothetical protein
MTQWLFRNEDNAIVTKHSTNKRGEQPTTMVAKHEDHGVLANQEEGQYALSSKCAREGTKELVTAKHS